VRQRGDSKFGFQLRGRHVLQGIETDGFGRAVEEESVVRESALQPSSLEPHEGRDVVGGQLDVKNCMVARRRRDTGDSYRGDLKRDFLLTLLSIIIRL
jgi:hypothetical protein